MTTKLAPVHPLGTEERQHEDRSQHEDPSGEETMRLMAALWEWAAGRERDG